MNQSKYVAVLVSAILCSAGAMAQSGYNSQNSGSVNQTTPDGKTNTPDATIPVHKDGTANHVKRSKTRATSHDNSQNSGSVNQTTPDGKTNTPDATIPVTK